MSYAIISAPFFYSHLQPKLCVKTPTTLTLELEEDKPSKKKKAHCLLEFGKPVRKELKMLTFLKTRPGCWENWSSPLQARPKVNWGVTGGGGAAPDAAVSSSAMKHSIVLQTPPISLLPPNPSTALDVLLSYCLIGCAKCRSKYPALKKHWPLASTIKPIMEQEG